MNEGILWGGPRHRAVQRCRKAEDNAKVIPRGGRTLLWGKNVQKWIKEFWGEAQIVRRKREKSGHQVAQSARSDNWKNSRKKYGKKGGREEKAGKKLKKRAIGGRGKRICALRAGLG